MQRIQLVIAILAVTLAGATRGRTEERSIAARIAGRDFPSVFQAWSSVENVPDVNHIEGIAKHDLMWSCPGLRWDGTPVGLARRYTPESIERARRIRRYLLKLNPNIVLIREIRYRDARADWLPDGHPWWRRDEDGQIVKGWDEGGFLQLDFANPAFRRHVAQRAKAAVDSGAIDGILLDWWIDDNDRLALVRDIRAAIGDAALIIANSNDRQAPRTAPYINGFFMECFRSRTVEDWHRIAATLTWAERHLRPPRVNCVEVWYDQSRRDLHLMRAVTSLALTHSDGYCLFSDPNPLPTPDHRHDWYAFWDTPLGKPLAASVTRPDGVTLRRYDHGVAAYNPMGNRAVTVTFDTPHTSQATGRTGTTHTVPACDGDIFLKTAER